MRIRRLLMYVLFGGAGLGLGASDATAPSLETWIVTYDAPPTVAQIQALTGIATGGVHAYQHLPAAVAVVPPDVVGLLGNLPGVRAVYPNRILQPLLYQSARTIHADGVWADGYTGAGIGIAVIDAGVDGTHPDLCARIEFCNGTPVKTVQNVKILGDQQDGVDPVVLLEDQVSTDSSSGHGTHVSGIAAGWGVSSTTPGKYRGIANGARLIGLGTGEVLEVVTVMAGFDWVLGHKDDPRYNIKVINNSWGPGAGAQYDPNEPVQRAIAAAYDAGLSVVFGSGNDGPKTGTINVFSANPKAISAAAGTKAGHIALFSSRGVPGSSLYRPTVTTPGQFIASTRARTGFYADIADASGPDPNNPILPPDDAYYAFASGTSMSSPHVAGMVALMQEAAIRNRGRYLTPGEVKNVLQNTAVSRDPARGGGGLPNYQDYSMGAGYADALAAVHAVVAGTGLQTYDDHVTYDVRGFQGPVTASSSSFETTYSVAPGAISLDVMIDWQYGTQQSAATSDLDIDLYRPDGSLYRSTAVCVDFTFTLCLGTEEGPNQYSSAFTTIPSERINVNYPVAGLWRAVVHGTVSASETANGMWSIAYPDGTALSPGQTAVSIVVTGPLTPTAVGQKAVLTAMVTDASGNPVINAPVSWTSTGVGSVLTSEPATDERGMALATVTSDSAGTQTATAHSGTAAGSTGVTWIGLTVPPVPPPPASTPGRTSGGGWFNNPGKRNFGFYAEYTAQSTAPGGDLSYDDKVGTKVKATGIGSLVIDGNKATVTGTASLNGNSGFRFQLDAVDNGEPGSSDTFHLLVTNPLSPLWKYETQGTLGGGNIQVQRY